MEIKQLPDDAPDFIAALQFYVNGVLDLHKPAELILINIDNWFGQKWLHFCGKAVGAVGVWNRIERSPALTVPPFVPHRIRSEHTFLAPEYREARDREPIHRNVESQYALRRYMSEVAPAASILWYSGGSRRVGRGSIMAYVRCGSSYWTWYAELAESCGWYMTTAKGITEQDLAAFKNTAGVVPFASLP